MSRISVDVSSARIPVLQVGYQGENEVTDVLFDISSWITEFGEGVAQLRVKRPGNSEDESYVLSLTITDGIAVWTVSETDTANKGNGKVQLSYMVGSILKKAVIYPYKVGKSIVGADNPVDPFDSWIERSKAWAIGKTLDGGDVPETDETYQNNAKYYAEQADILGSAQVVLAAEKVTLAAEQVTLATEKADAAAASEAAVNGVSTQLTTRMSAIETEQSVQSARMDTFTSLPEGSTSGNAELADIRVDADGTTYDTAGNAVRGQIGELKSDLNELKDGFQSIDEFATFINGSDYKGSFEDKKYRVVTENIISLDRDITLTVKNGFKFGVHFFVNNVFSSEFGWITSNYIIPSGSMFKIIIARTSENTSEIADIATFCSNVILQSDIDYKIEVNRKNIDKNYLLIKNLETGKDSLYEYGTFIRGSLYQSNLENKKYRICSETVVHFGRDVELTIADGFRIVIEYYNADGTYRSGEDSGWLTGTVTILADKYVKINIARTSENTSEIADIATFVEAVSFSNETNYRLTKSENRLTKLENSIYHDYVETPWIQEIHRGLTSDTIPENTIPSFLEVAKNGFKQFECDVRKTSDGILVMSHDAEFNGYVVAETDYETLNSVVISTDSVYGEIHIAKFEDVLKVAYFNDLTINIDIKDSSAINDVVNMVIANGMSGRAIYNPNTGETSVGLAIMEIDKRATVIYPYNKDNIENYYPQAFVDKSKIIICIPYYNMTNEAMDVIRASGFKSLIYDVLSSTWFEKRPDIIEYRTASASTINELNKTYLDGIIY